MGADDLVTVVPTPVEASVVEEPDDAEMEVAPAVEEAIEAFFAKGMRGVRGVAASVAAAVKSGWASCDGFFGELKYSVGGFTPCNDMFAIPFPFFVCRSWQY